MDLKNKIKQFFYPAQKVYYYDLPVAASIPVIQSIINKKRSFGGSFDIDIVRFNEREFKFTLVSPASTNGARFSSAMYCTLSESENNTTIVSGKIVPAVTVYIIFFLAIIGSFIFIINFFFNFDAKSLAWFLLTGFGGPAIAMTIAGASKTALELRYQMYFDKELKNKITTQ